MRSDALWLADLQLLCRGGNPALRTMQERRRVTHVGHSVSRCPRTSGGITGSSIGQRSCSGPNALWQQTRGHRDSCPSQPLKMQREEVSQEERIFSYMLQVM